MAAKPAPPINAPASDVTVRVSAIDTTLWMDGVACNIMWDPEIKGFNSVKCGAWCFLIEHPSGRKLLYDLGCRKDFENSPPALGLKQMVESGMMLKVEVEKNVSTILEEGGTSLKEIEGIIWSHWYVFNDHIKQGLVFVLNVVLLVIGTSIIRETHPRFPVVRS